MGIQYLMKWPSQAGVSLHPWNAVPGIAPAEPTWALMPGGQRWAAPRNLDFSFSSSFVFMSHSKGSRNKIPFACLNLLPQSFLSQMQLMSVPLDMTDSASLECSQSIFFPRMFHPILFLILCFVPSTHGLFRSPLVLFWYRIFLSLLDLLDVEVDGSQWSHRDILPSCADPRAGIDSNALRVFRASLTAAEGRNSLWLCDNISEQ